MEDILASIRRIIADDQSQGGKAPAFGNGTRRLAGAPPDGERTMTRARTPYDDVLDLARLVPSADRAAEQHVSTATAPVLHDEAPGAQREAVEAVAEQQFQEEDGSGSVSGLRARLPEPVARGATQHEDYEMLDHTAPALSDDSDGDLLSAPLGESVMSAFEALAATVVLQNTPMLERVMRDLLRPMLKTWLDDNLPSLVERLVRTEIERVARGTRG